MRLFSLALLALLTLTACDSSDPDTEPTPIDVRLATNVEADPTEGRDPVTGRPVSNNLFTLFDLDAGEVVLSSSETDPAVRQRDSVSTTWDVGFKGSTLIFNGGASGPGQGSAQLLTSTFADVVVAPESGYAQDGSNTCPSVQTPGGTFPGSPYAICTGSDNGWYNYNGAVLTPIAGRTIVLTTGEGNYAKMRVLSYYRDMPDAPTQDSESRYYTFEYVVQPDGSRNLSETTVR
jgi:hypothetical protein